VLCVAEDAEADLVGGIVIDLLLQGDFDALESQFQSGGIFAVHLVHRASGVYHHHHYLLVCHVENTLREELHF
jgi:hypothetical protein